MTPLQVHVQNWINCDRCSLAATRKQVCIVRGTVPCDVLLVGEAPGKSEDVLGAPFLGPAGKLLDGIVKNALPEGVTSAFTNIVGCLPLDEEGNKNSEPDDDSIQACKSRLVDLVSIAEPKLIVCVGKLSSHYLMGGYKYGHTFPSMIPMVEIVHPAAILRASFAHQGLMKQRATVVLKTATEKHVLGMDIHILGERTTNL